MTRPLVTLGALLGALVLGVGLWAFEPWRLFTSSEIDEAAPRSEPTSQSTGEPTPSPEASTETTPGATPEPERDVVLSESRFVDAEHDTSGTAKVIRLADGRRFLRLEDLASSDGPDLHMWLSDAESGGDWGSYDDGRYVKLGELKATHGNQNYEIPADADLASMRSVVIWCDRFNVAFGTAPLRLS